MHTTAPSITPDLTARIAAAPAADADQVHVREAIAHPESEVAFYLLAQRINLTRLHTA